MRAANVLTIFARAVSTLTAVLPLTTAVGCQRQPHPSSLHSSHTLATAPSAHLADDASQAKGASTTIAEAPVATTSANVPSQLLTWALTDPQLGPIHALVRVPEHQAGARLGVLVALHGRAEALKGPVFGARGFVDDYHLLKAWRWLSDVDATEPPIGLPQAFRGHIVETLRTQPFTGMVVLMPYVPDLFARSLAFVNNDAYARVLRQLSQRALDELPVDADPRRWALDGISLGGRVALVTGPLLADRFGTVASIQAAIDEKELSQLTNLMAGAQQQHSHLHYSVVTSDQDYYRDVLHDFHQRLRKAGVSHDFNQLPGDHSYAFNRGPGVTHLLVYHDRRINQRAEKK